MRLWPKTLAGQTLALLIGVTVLLLIGSAIIVHDERQESFDERNRFHLIDRVSTLVRLLSDADDEERIRIIEKVSGQGDDIKLSDAPRVKRPPRHPFERIVSHKLRRVLQIDDRSAVRVKVFFDDDDHDDHEEHEDEHRGRNGRTRVYDLKGIDIAIRLWDDKWLNMWTENFEGPPPWTGKTLQLFALLLITLVISGLVIARRMTRPMAQLAEAADRFGMGQNQKPMPETGPREVRSTIRAFNQMQQRLHKHITERSNMLAAVSHDLRTPITLLRLRAEYIEDEEMREKTIATLAEMEAILTDTLSFAKDEAADENARSTDLAALMQSLVDDHNDLGGKASYQGPDKLIFICRPVALKRALNNLISNAQKYGQMAATELLSTPTGVEIHIDDDGPGIPEAQLEEVFTPFFRLEASRNRETGGTGLGLAVARTIILAHGGELMLHNRAEGGLRASIQLPQMMVH